jgi:predicted metal-binding protein
MQGLIPIFESGCRRMQRMPGPGWFGLDGDGHEMFRSHRERVRHFGVHLMTSAHSGTTVFVCVTCKGPSAEATPTDRPRAGAQFLAAISEAAGGASDGLSVVPVECLSNCSRACTVAVTAPGKWTFVLGTLDPALHAGDVLTFARLHQAHEAGLPVWRQRPEYLRKNTIARVPPLPRLSEEVLPS